MGKLVAALLALSLCTSALAQAGQVGGSGRYVIVHSPHVQSDTMLLDTATGKTWLLIQDSSREGEPLAWEPVARSDNPLEMQELFKKHPLKPAH